MVIKASSSHASADLITNVMSSRHWSLEEALAHLRRQRPVVRMNKGFKISSYISYSQPSQLHDSLRSKAGAEGEGGEVAG